MVTGLCGHQCHTNQANAYAAQVMLRVTDLDASIKYYTEALGCKLLRKKDNPEYKYTLAFLGYGLEDESTVFELTYNWCPPVAMKIFIA